MQQNIDIEAHPLDLRVHDDVPGGESFPMTVRASAPGHEDTLTQGELRADETLPQAQQMDADTPPAHGSLHTGSSSQRPQENPMVEDFDDSANALWSLYVKEAKSHDEATVGTIRDDMEGVLIFAGLFSAALTAFIIDRSQNIQQSPAQQSAYFQQQSAVLLNQISHQLSSLGAQFPSNLSLERPTFSPSGLDVRVNIYWFSSLVFSLSAALLATLVQRWARDHMHVFSRYSYPLKIARIRQYLHEGVERWYMLAIAEAVPGLVHISLFLFLIGLADFLWHTCAIVGKLTIFPIILCGTLYIISSVAPLVSPQSPYRTSFTGFAWSIAQKLPVLKRTCKGRNGEPDQPLSSNMADGQMQLAMAMNDARRGRDGRAIRWLVENLTEDIEMESLASGIPGSFDAKWGVEVWRNDSETRGSTRPTPSDNPAPYRHQLLYRHAFSSLLGYISTLFSLSHWQSGDSQPSINTPAIPAVQTNTDAIPQPPSHLPGEIVQDLCQRIQRLFETCSHRASFLNEEEWRRRSRACVETAASFVFCMNAEISSFGDIGKVLGDLGKAERTREVSASSLNRTFTTRWTCLSLVAIREMLKSPELERYVSGTMQTLGTLSRGSGSSALELALISSQKIDEQFAAAWDCVERLRQAFKALGEGRKRVERVEEVLLLYKPRLERIQIEADRLKRVDTCISDLQNQIDQVTHNLTRHLPGVVFDELAGPTSVGQVFDFLANPVRPQLLYFSPRLLGLCSLSQKRSSRGYLEAPEILRGVEMIPPSLRSVPRDHHLMERQLWRLEDLSGGRAFGFTLELYFLSLRQILSTFTSSPREIDISFYVGAFKAITSDWEEVKWSLGTLQIILNIVCDIAIRDRGIFSNCEYPDYITKELLKLLGKMVEGQANPNIDAAINGLRTVYIDAAIEELRIVEWRTGDRDFLEGVLRTFQEHRAPSDSDSS